MVTFGRLANEKLCKRVSARHFLFLESGMIPFNSRAGFAFLETV